MKNDHFCLLKIYIIPTGLFIRMGIHYLPIFHPYGIVREERNIDNNLIPILANNGGCIKNLKHIALPLNH